MRSRSALAGLVLGLLAVLTAGTQAHAAEPKTDVGLKGSVSSLEGNMIGNDTTAVYYQHNYGPVTANGWLITDIWAPGGTRFRDGYPSLRSDCVKVTERQVRCKGYGSLWVDGHYNAPLEGYKIFVPLTVTNKSHLTCGKVTMTYSGDTKSSNNTAYMRLTYKGSPSTCFPKPSPKPRPKPSAKPSPSPAASASAIASPSVEPSDTAGQAETQQPATQTPLALAGDDSSGGAGSAVVIGGGAALVVAGGAIVWWVRRRRTEVSPEE